uniref:Diacylglycerol kinase n=1 Tax=Oncorhynchus kisutch TaxID=8019 RepID=A0A8C7KMC5_ONCKI
MASKLNPNVLYVQELRESTSSQESDRLAPPEPGEESSDSDGETDETEQKLIRKVSTSGQLRAKKSVKEGILLKQTSSFQRWKRRYFKLRGRTLYYAKDSKSLIFDEVDLSDASVAETSTKNINNSFTVITPFRKLMLCAESRKEMEDWIGALKSVQKWEILFNMEHFSGMHNWYACSHARPTFCNVCREALSGVTSHGLSCEVCKFKAHKRCAVRSTNTCKWTTLASIGNDIMEDDEGVSMPHQWLEGNLPVSAKCVVCDKNCGSVRRLQDWRCLWCKAIVHSSCKEQMGKACPLGQCRVSIIPPTTLNSIDSDGFWKATSPSCTSPLLVLCNSKSGDNQGVKFLRKFKQLLNPAQVFDLMNGGPQLGLRVFQKFATFRILVCGGDGSVGWVLSELDKLNLHKQCQLGVLPLGTGNDLARVLGWGGLCDDDAQLLQILEKLERVHITQYADSVASHLTKILDSDKHTDVISSAKFLCGTVNDFVAEVGRAYERATENKEEADAMAKKCALLNEKLDSLVKALSEEADAQVVPAGSVLSFSVGWIAFFQLLNWNFILLSELTYLNLNCLQTCHRSREQLMLRANSLKKALRQIIEQAEKGIVKTEFNVFGLGVCKLPTSTVHCDTHTHTEALMYCRRPHKISHTALSIFLSPTLSLFLTPLSLSSAQFTINPSLLIQYYSEWFYRSCRKTRGIYRLLISAQYNSIIDIGEYSCSLCCVYLYSQCSEKCVMNNYFGIGLDAKISLEFNNKRDEHPKKCSSRTKNKLWYGVMGTKELVHKTYKNLEQRVLLESSGLAVLNIPSYAGGINFWGGTKEDNNFGAPSFDDKKLEVVAVVINIQHHRIAQCRQVKITILGEEGVPVQVDGEAWIQPPGIVKITHKNRAQMLTRDRNFERTLTSWEDKRKIDTYRSSRPRLNSQQSMEYLTEEECAQVQQLGMVADTLITSVGVFSFCISMCVSLRWSVCVHVCVCLCLCVRVSVSVAIAERWESEEVAAWLYSLGLGEYRDTFLSRDIQGCQLSQLQRHDLKVQEDHRKLGAHFGYRTRQPFWV